MARPTGRRTERQVLGRRAEDIAVEFLAARGLRIVCRNFRLRCGELDIVARDGDELIIVEVRTRSGERYGGAAASVDWRKRQRLIRAGQLLLAQRPDLANCRARFDVITVKGIGTAAAPSVQWLRHAFST